MFAPMGYPPQASLERDCEGQPPFTWGLGLCPNFLIFSHAAAGGTHEGYKEFLQCSDAGIFRNEAFFLSEGVSFIQVRKQVDHSEASEASICTNSLPSAARTTPGRARTRYIRTICTPGTPLTTIVANVSNTNVTSTDVASGYARNAFYKPPTSAGCLWCCRVGASQVG
jgi:hypothetical protein